MKSDRLQKAKLAEYLQTRVNPTKSVAAKLSSGSPLLKIGEAAKVLGVSIDTLRRWEEVGKIKSIRTAGGTRLYSIELLQQVAGKKRSYRRVEQADKLQAKLQSKDTVQLPPSQLLPTPAGEDDSIISQLPNKELANLITPGISNEVEQIIQSQQAHSLYESPLTQQPEIDTNESIIAIPEDKPETTLEADKISKNKLHILNIKHRNLGNLASVREKIYAGATLLFVSFTLLISALAFTKITGSVLPFALPTPLKQLAANLQLDSQPISLAGVNPNNFSQNLATIPNLNSGKVLAGTTVAHYLEINSDTAINGSLAVSTDGVFGNSVTAPNIIYGVRAGANVAVSAGQTPTISVNLPALVNSFQGSTGAINLAAGTDIAISGLTISDTATLSSVRGRGGCDSCIVDDDVSNTLTLDSSSSVSGSAIKSGTVASSYGGTGITSYTKGDIIYSSATSTLATLGIGTSGQVLQVSSSGVPSWANATGTLSGGGNNGYVAYWTGATSLSSEQYLSTSRGGTGLDGSAASNGQLLIGNGTGYSLATLTPGTGVTVTNGAGTISLAASLLNAVDGIGTTASYSGLEFAGGSSDQLSLLQGCSDGELLKWDNTSKAWVCSTDLGGSTAIINVAEGATTYSGIDTLRFSANDFNVSKTTSTADVSIDYTNGQLATSGQNGFLSAADWTTFNSRQAGDADLTALAGLGSTGIAVRTGSNTWSQRMITGTTNQVIVTNGDGVSGNPTLSLPQDIALTSSPTFSALALTATSNQLLLGTTNIGTLTWTPSTTQTITLPDATGTVALGTGTSGQITGWTGTSSLGILTDLPTATTIGSSYIYRVGGTDVAVTDGGTGKSSWTQYSIPYLTDTSTFGEIAIGTSGTVLVSSGTGYTWSTISGVGAVTGTGTSNYVTRWTGSSSLATGVLYDNGAYVGIGTTNPGSLLTVGNNTFTVNSSGNILGNTLALTASSNQIVLDTNGTLTWTPSTTQTITLPDATGTVALGTGTSGGLAAWNGTNSLTNLTSLDVSRGGTGHTSWTQYGLLYADTTSSLSQVGIGTTGQLLATTGTGYSWIDNNF
ncbi:MerR family DNA-binding transcriptional regulator, partial [Patescibacteria group bacterium]|nr:MerR family DNA-binding transcriptional regulator [Patescibacteria group bacterium]MCL5409313.1 MerR family DNA-binding transcriptional regulator [Patescibacteria group bacterium]